MAPYTARLSKKLLCLLDESGTAGKEGFCMGALVVSAHHAARLDKRFSDLLHKDAQEIHSNRLDDRYVFQILSQLRDVTSDLSVTMVCRQSPSKNPDGYKAYVELLDSTIKAAVKRFRHSAGHKHLNNVDVILDANHYNERPEFDASFFALREEGITKSVRRISKIDSCASRLLQIADIIAYIPKLKSRMKIDSRAISDKLGVEMM